MREFDFYEFAGILAPGALALLGVGFAYPSAWQLINDRTLSIGDLGVFLILAYVAGHLIQAVGNLVEMMWWRIWGGWPTDWLRSGARPLLATQQVKAIHTAVKHLLHLADDTTVTKMDRVDWASITRQMYAKVQAADQTERIDTFNGNYGICRGIAAALLVVLIILLVDSGLQIGLTHGLIILGIGLALYRMHRFGQHYARELFVQFLTLNQDPAQAVTAKE